MQVYDGKGVFQVSKGVGVPLFINKTVGDSVELLAGLERGHFISLQWKYRGKDIAEVNSEELISKVVIQTDITLFANHSCTVRLVCNVSCYSNLTYTWERDNEMYGDAQQIHFSLSPAERDISVTCNDSNLVSWKTVFATVKCSNDKTAPGT
ncbi:unnamed protein product [Coregonus sp. 'balchen']|nr:unnamed protein product [Coregonus sp. 'balchen']